MRSSPQHVQASVFVEHKIDRDRSRDLSAKRIVSNRFWGESVLANQSGWVAEENNEESRCDWSVDTL